MKNTRHDLGDNRYKTVKWVFVVYKTSNFHLNGYLVRWILQLVRQVQKNINCTSLFEISFVYMFCLCYANVYNGLVNHFLITNGTLLIFIFLRVSPRVLFSKYTYCLARRPASVFYTCISTEFLFVYFAVTESSEEAAGESKRSFN